MCAPKDLIYSNEGECVVLSTEPRINYVVELWKGLCIRAYPAVAETLRSSDSDEPVSWRSEFLHLREEEARRFEEAANRIRNQRLEAEELKRKRQVKITDRLPPPKRPRHGWSSGPAPPKTLFEKTRAEASKFQKNVFNSRAVPPPLNTKSIRPKLGSSNVPLFPPSKSAPVAVTTVTVRTSSRPSHSPPQSIRKPEVPASSLSRTESRPSTRPPPEPTASLPPRRLAATTEKDPMASLFVPKHKAHSQLSTVAHISPHKVLSR